jgi:hypothetical protein
MPKTQNNAVRNFRAKIAKTDLRLFDEILSLLEDLMYVPQLTRAKTSVLVFVNRTLKETIAKFTVQSGSRLHFYTKFYAVRPYPSLYVDSLKHLHDYYGETYWRCNCESCGRCKGEPQHYIYERSDGKKDFYCGAYLYEIRNISPDDIQEIKQALSRQHRYFLSRHATE